MDTPGLSGRIFISIPSGGEGPPDDPDDSVFRVNDDGSFTRLYRGSQNLFRLAVDAAGRVWQADSGVSLIDAAGSRSLV